MEQNYLEIFGTISARYMKAIYENMVRADTARDRPWILDTYAKEIQKGW